MGLTNNLFIWIYDLMRKLTTTIDALEDMKRVAEKSSIILTEVDNKINYLTNNIKVNKKQLLAFDNE